MAQSIEQPLNQIISALPEFAKVRAKLLDRIQSGEIPSCAIGVVRNSTILWEESLGWADREAGIPATTVSMYPVASVSKSITATGALILAADGRLNLNDPVDSILGADWIPSTCFSPDGLLISHLIEHTSGIPHLWHYEYTDDLSTIIGRNDLIKTHGFIAARPGERYIYTNLGYGVLAQVIETVGKSPFQKVMEQSLFNWIGMHHTTVDHWVGEVDTVKGYDGAGKVIPYIYRLIPDGGAGFFSCVHDLNRYVLFHLGASGSAIANQTFANASIVGCQPTKGIYKHGWGVVQLPDVTFLISDGEMAGGSAGVVIIPELHLGVVVLCNVTGGPVQEVALEILTSLHPKISDQFMEAVNIIEQDLRRPGQLPPGRYTGFLSNGIKVLPQNIDLSNSETPIIGIDGLNFTSETISWERNTLQFSIKGLPVLFEERDNLHNLSMTIWMEGKDLNGIAQADYRAVRPGSGIPYQITLKPFVN